MNTVTDYLVRVSGSCLGDTVDSEELEGFVDFANTWLADNEPEHLDGRFQSVWGNNIPGVVDPHGNSICVPDIDILVSRAIDAWRSQ